jgi:hypothetical protein
MISVEVTRINSFLGGLIRNDYLLGDINDKYANSGHISYDMMQMNRSIDIPDQGMFNLEKLKWI